MQNKWLILLGLWIIFVGLCFFWVDKSVSIMMILLIAVGLVMLGWFVVSNILDAKHRKEIK